MFPMDAIAVLAHAVVAVAALRLHAATGVLTLLSHKMSCGYIKSGQKRKNSVLIIIVELLVQHVSMLLGRNIRRTLTSAF